MNEFKEIKKNLTYYLIVTPYHTYNGHGGPKIYIFNRNFLLFSSIFFSIIVIKDKVFITSYYLRIFSRVSLFLTNT